MTCDLTGCDDNLFTTIKAEGGRLKVCYGHIAAVTDAARWLTKSGIMKLADTFHKCECHR